MGGASEHPSCFAEPGPWGRRCGSSPQDSRDSDNTNRGRPLPPQQVGEHMKKTRAWDLLGGEEPRGTARYPGQVAAGDWRESLLLGTICCVQGSHVAGGGNEVDDTDDRLEQGDGGCDPEAHSEEPHRAN